LEVFTDKLSGRIFLRCGKYNPFVREHRWSLVKKIVYSEKFKKEEGLDHLSETVGLWEINCQEKKMYLLSTSHTSKEGEISPPQVWLPPEWKSISPGTIMDTLYKELCK